MAAGGENRWPYLGRNRWPLTGMHREVTVRLDRPLGGRVLVDLDSTPAEVLSDG